MLTITTTTLMIITVAIFTLTEITVNFTQISAKFLYSVGGTGTQNKAIGLKQLAGHQMFHKAKQCHSYQMFSNKYTLLRIHCTF